jgi:hypothetical protein
MHGNCPRCLGEMPKYPALSRISTPTNKIYVCSWCGVDEAMLQFKNNGVAVQWETPTTPKEESQ